MPQLIASVEGVEIKHVYLHKDRTTLGRKPDNDIVLDNLVVSGQHCVFQLKGLADVFVEDLGSTNGTFINNQKVKRQRLHDGDVIAIGQFRIQYLSTSGDSGFQQTQSFMPDSSFGGTLHACFRVLNGSSAGLEVPVVKAVTTFGKPTACVVSVSHRRNGFFVGYLAGEQKPLLNGAAIGDEPVLLSNNDVLELAGTRMLFQLEA
ncbi:MAG TPA: FHA domain-containing protein [Ramlibacter sp.]|nr:FHA domain-containing protein [Ramlibacter sp.]